MRNDGKGTGSMRPLAEYLTLAALLLGGLLAPAQPSYGQLPAPGIGFRNDLKIPIIVQGVSLVNNMQRRGQPFLIKPGKTVWDNNLPTGVRYYSFYDGNQQRILLRDRAVRVQAADQFFAIRVATGGLTPIKIDSEKVPKP
jgi:hypothetical protein